MVPHELGSSTSGRRYLLGLLSVTSTSEQNAALTTLCYHVFCFETATLRHINHVAAIIMTVFDHHNHHYCNRYRHKIAKGNLCPTNRDEQYYYSNDSTTCETVADYDYDDV